MPNKSDELERRVRSFMMDVGIKKRSEEYHQKKRQELFAFLERYSKDNSVDFDTGIDIGVRTWDDLRQGEFVSIRVKRISPVSVVFDAEKLSKALPKPVAEKVIKNRVTVIDIFGLLAYMKGLGADPKKTKSFFNVEKNVDKDAIERLAEIGDIRPEQLNGCFSAKESKVYFTFTENKK